jgi:cytochrome c55X
MWPIMARLIAGALALLLSSGAMALATEPDGERQAELIHMLRHECGACHGMTLKGGLGLPLVPARLATIDSESLVTTILDGRQGTPMPPWRTFLSRAEADWLVARLKEGIDHAQ